MRPRVYFDHHATSPLHPAARAARDAAEASAWGNPSSAHAEGVAAAAALERAAASVAATLGVEPERVVWVSGATEAAHAAVVALAAGARAGEVALAGAGEHPAVQGALVAGWTAGGVEELPLDGTGRVAVEGVVARLACGGVGLVALQAANSETGAHQPWREVVAAARMSGVATLVDATAWIGREDPAGLGEADAWFFGGHKIGAPRGIGVLVLGRERSARWLAGGGQQGGRRGGTEPVALAAGLAAALAAVEAARPSWAAAQRAERDALEAFLAEAWGPHGFRVLGTGGPRLPNASAFVAPWANQSRWVLQLDRQGVAVGTGAACSSGRGKASVNALAAGLDPAAAGRMLRVTAGWSTTTEDWAALRAALLAVGARLATETGGACVLDDFV